MRYIFICFLLFFISENSLFAQQSIGFSNPDSLQPLLDYRLPDWGYSNFSLDLGLNGRGFDNKSNSNISVLKRGVFNFSPSYQLFRESENRIFKFNTNLDFSYSRRVQKMTNQTDGLDTRDLSRDFQTRLNIFVDVREYWTDQTFLFGKLGSNLIYGSSKGEEKEEGTLTDETLSYNRLFSVTPRLGLGFGRIRNVNPVIRSIRLNERLGALNKGLNFTRQDILRAADQFTRFDGYQQTYNRPEKYFWDGLDEVTSTNLSSLDTFDVFYLTDVFDEAIGLRQEGWEVIGGVEFDYQNDLRRTEELLNSGEVVRNTTIDKELGIFLNSRWYKNTSLSHQWGMFVDAVLSYPLDENQGSNIDDKKAISFRTGLNWLWNVADRILFRTTLTEDYRRIKREFRGQGSNNSEFSEWINQVSLNLNLNYFIENKAVINAWFTPSLVHRGDTGSENKLNSREFDWRIGASLKYYFRRNLY